jgi:hypothetical protein
VVVEAGLLASPLYRRASRILGVREDVLEREALRQYILSRLRRVRLEYKLIMARYGVSSIRELDAKIRRGELAETEAFEDLTRLDHLLDYEEKLKRLLEELEGAESE